MNAADWTKRYPRIVEQAAQIKGSAIIDAEAVWLDTDGIARFDALHSRVMDHTMVACAFDLLMLWRRSASTSAQRALRKVLRRMKGGIHDPAFARTGAIRRIDLLRNDVPSSPSLNTSSIPVKGGPDVRFGSKADICDAKGHVRFTPKSGHLRRN